MRIGALCVIYQDDVWLASALSRVMPEVDVTLVVQSVDPWNGPRYRDNTDGVLRDLAQTGHVQVHMGSFRTERDQRNFGLRLLETMGCDWTLIVDADEIWTAHGLRSLTAAIRSTEYAVDQVQFRAPWYTYWKSHHWRIEPPESFQPIVAVRTSQVRFTRARQTDCDTRKSALLGRPEYLHHMSYARSDTQILRKIQSFSHSHEIVPGWYDDVWRSWTPSMRNIHPTTPSAFRQAVSVPPGEGPFA